MILPLLLSQEDCPQPHQHRCLLTMFYLNVREDLITRIQNYPSYCHQNKSASALVLGLDFWEGREVLTIKFCAKFGMLLGPEYKYVNHDSYSELFTVFILINAPGVDIFCTLKYTKYLKIPLKIH